MKTTAFLVFPLLAASVLAQEVPANKVQMAIPGVKGVLEIGIGAATPETRVRPDGKEVQLRAFERPDHLVVSAFLQKVPFSASPEKCRDEWWPRTRKSAPLKRDDLQESTKNGIARVAYIVPSFRGVKIRQKSLHAYLGSSNLCAEIHLSKVAFNPDEQKLFEVKLCLMNPRRRTGARR